MKPLANTTEYKIVVSGYGFGSVAATEQFLRERNAHQIPTEVRTALEGIATSRPMTDEEKRTTDDFFTSHFMPNVKAEERSDERGTK